MTYQPYPTGSGSNEAAGNAGRPPKPSALRNAVRLMWAGAALAVISVITTLAFSSKVKSAVTKAAIKANATRRSDGKTVLTTSQIHSLANITIAVLVVVVPYFLAVFAAVPLSAGDWLLRIMPAA